MNARRAQRTPPLAFLSVFIGVHLWLPLSVVDKAFRAEPAGQEGSATRAAQALAQRRRLRRVCAA